MSKLAKFKKRHGAPKRNPPLGTDVVQYILPGFAAFAVTRVATRIATTQISKRWPKLAKHAGALASVGSFAAAYLGAHRVKYLDRFHHPIVVGAGLAALQNLVQLYAPKLGSLLGDPMPATLPSPKAQLLMTAQQDPMQQLSDVPPGFRPTTANEWYTYNDSFDAGSYKGKEEGQQTPVPGARGVSEPDEMQVTDLLDNSDLLDSTDLGSFS